jgi:flagellar motor switch protein FliN/FliY
MAAPTPLWHEHRDLAEAIGQAYADALTSFNGKTVMPGNVGSFDPEQMFAKRPLPLRATVVRFNSPLRDVVIMISSLKEEVITPLAIAGAQQVLSTFDIAGDVSLDETVEFTTLDIAMEQCDALWLEATYGFELTTGEVRLVIGTGVLESANSYVNGVADPFADGATPTPAVFDGPAMETLDSGADEVVVAPTGIDDFEAELAEQERAEAVEVAAIAAAAPLAPAASPGSAPGDQRQSPEAWASLLSGVEVELSAELGCTELALGDITSLTGDSVLTLDKMVDEPVTVHVNGTPYATARLVVVDGEYGIEIIEVVEQPSVLGTLAA